MNIGSTLLRTYCLRSFTYISSVTTALSADRTKAIAVFADLLDTGVDYYLAETRAPVDYRRLDTPLKITIDDLGNTALINGNIKDITAKEVNVELANTSGIQLPITGSTGTVIFTVVGVALMVGAVVLLGVSLKKSKANTNNKKRKQSISNV